jgi:hypothetical protein
VCVQHEPLEPECQEAVKERDRQAAADLRFIPHLADACAAEVHTLCKGGHLKGSAVIDCLADNRYVRDPVYSTMQGPVVMVVHHPECQAGPHSLMLLSLQHALHGCPPTCTCRHKPEFSTGCRTALVNYLADAVSDVRLLHSLKQDCSQDITRSDLLVAS